MDKEILDELEKEISKVVDHWVSSVLKNMLIGQSSSEPKNTSLLQKFKHGLSNWWHGSEHEDNPYRWQNKFGNLGVKESLNPFFMFSLSEYKEIKNQIESFELILNESNDFDNLKLMQTIKSAAQQLKTNIYLIVSKLLLKKQLEYLKVQKVTSNSETPFAPPETKGGKPTMPIDSDAPSKSPEEAKSPEVVKSKSPKEAKSKSPEVVKSKSPEEAKSKSPEVVKSKSPEVVKSKSPEEAKSKSPEEAKSKSPEEAKSKSPEEAKSQKERLYEIFFSEENLTSEKILNTLKDIVFRNNLSQRRKDNLETWILIKKRKIAQMGNESDRLQYLENILTNKDSEDLKKLAESFKSTPNEFIEKIIELAKK